MKYDVRVAIVETTIFILRPVNHTELLYPPYFESLFIPCFCPGGLVIASVFAYFFLELPVDDVGSTVVLVFKLSNETHIRAKQGYVRVFNVIFGQFCQLSHGG